MKLRFTREIRSPARELVLGSAPRTCNGLQKCNFRVMLASFSRF